MNNTIVQGLLITVIGMGLVFLVIIFLWWMMGTLVRVTSKAEEQAATPDVKPGTGVVLKHEVVGWETHRRVVAAAVAVALAMEEEEARRLRRGIPGEMGGINPWQSVHRTQQLEQHNKRG